MNRSKNEISELNNLHPLGKSIFTEVQVDLLSRSNNPDTVKKNEKIGSKANIEDIYDVYARIKEEKKVCIKLIDFLSSQGYGVFKTFLIVIFLLLTIPNILFNENKSLSILNTLIVIDLVILLIFFFDSLFNIILSSFISGSILILIEFCSLFIIICIYSALVFLHITRDLIQEEFVNIIGFMRFVRIFLIFLVYRYYTKIPLRKRTNVIYRNEDYLALPVDKILYVLYELKEKIPLFEKKLIKDIEYCIEMISRNKIYSPNIFNDKPSVKTQNEEAIRVKEEICFWIQKFALFEKEVSNKTNLEEVEIRCDTPKNLMKELTSDGMQGKIAKVFPNLNSESIVKCFKNIYSDKFNVFELQDATNNQELIAIMYFLFYNNDLLKCLNIRSHKFINFSKKIQAGYRKNPYHNSAHATDVVQTTHFYMTQCNMNTVLKLTDFEKAAMLIASMIHDVDHPYILFNKRGKNNTYLVTTNSELALNYNDKSVLENHHIAYSYKIISDKEFNIFENLTTIEYKQIRKIIISIIMCTDLASHFYELGNFKGRVVNLSMKFVHLGENNFTSIPEEDKLCIISNCVHFADISNQSKDWAICFKWTEYLYDEFFAQGDVERSKQMPLGFLNDRYKTNIGSAQVSFIEKFISPSFEALAILLPKVKNLIEIIAKNKKNWSDLIDHYDKKLRELEKNPNPITD